MLWLFLACTGGAPPECEVVYQTVADETPGDAPSGFEYCAEEDDGRGTFNRVSTETCEEGGFCTTDEDCRTGEACLCGGGVAVDGGESWRSMTALSQCVVAACASPDDCGGLDCSLTFDVCGSAQALFCHTKQDACQTDADCGGNQFCFYNGTKWACQERGECER
jgi:hypothetical protein